MVAELNIKLAWAWLETWSPAQTQRLPEDKVITDLKPGSIIIIDITGTPCRLLSTVSTVAVAVESVLSANA
jgi:hypothetical protein